MSKNIASQAYEPKDFSVSLVQEMLVTLGKRGFSPQMAEMVQDVKSGMADKIVELFKADISGILAEWKKFYQQIFKLNVDFSDLAIPEKHKDFNWLIIMLQDLTAQKLYNKCKKLFKVWKWTDESLDKILDQSKSARNPVNGTYAVWVRDRVEADEELKNRSADDFTERQNIQGITLEERLLLELFYYWKTKEHLDIHNWTLCSGSRYFDGGVPSVFWLSYYDELSVRWYDSGDADGPLRAREVVSC